MRFGWMLLLWSIAWTALGQEPAPTTRYISDETAVTLRAVTLPQMSSMSFASTALPALDLRSLAVLRASVGLFLLIDALSRLALSLIHI